MLRTLWDLFVAFFRASILSYGGGPASIPLIQSEAVRNYQWLNNEHFADALAIGNTLPGPIAPKMAAYIGYKVAGVLGAMVSVIATVVPTSIAIIIIADLLFAYKDSPRIQGMLKVAKPMVVVLLLQSSFELMTKKTYSNISAYFVSVIALVAIMFFKINPAIVTITGIAFGFVFYNLIL